jgi:hypothetical protein
MARCIHYGIESRQTGALVYYLPRSMRLNENTILVIVLFFNEYMTIETIFEK